MTDLLPQTRSFEGRVAVVTGGASGIGLAVTVALCRAGVRVHAVDMRPDVMAQRLADWGVVTHGLDVTDAAAVKTTFDEIGREGAVDILVCAAGLNIPQRRFGELTAASWERVVNVNLTGVFNCMQSLVPALRESHGHLVVIASVSSLWPDASGPAYQASKAGVLGLVRATAVEEKGSGIRFTSVLPGMVSTELLDKRPVPPTAEERALCIQPEDVAAAVMSAIALPDRTCLAEMTLVPTALQAVGRT